MPADGNVPQFMPKDFDQSALAEYFTICATEIILGCMEDQKISKAELARRIGCSRAHVTQMLDGRRNMTLRTLAKIAYHLGYRFEVEMKKGQQYV